MKTAMYFGLEDVRVIDVELPVVRPGEVLVKNHVALTCGTDVKTYLRGHPLWNPPVPFGHEAAGEVVAVGEGVSSFVCGDRVVAHNSAPCNICYYCACGQHSLCESISWTQGAFSEYQIIPAPIVQQNMFIIPEHLSFKDAALLEPFACAVYGISEAGIKLGDTVVVNGAGPIGLMLVRLASLQGAYVVVTDLSDMRLELALKLGASIAVNVSQVSDQIEAVKKLTENGRGVDVAIEAVGLPDVWEKTIGMCRKGGTVVLFGGPKPGSSIILDTKLIHYSQLTLKGVFHTTPLHTKAAFAMIKQGVISGEDFISTDYCLDDLELAILNHRSGEAVKNAIIF
jgi:L-iditol 2-dehydrogenase